MRTLILLSLCLFIGSCKKEESVVAPTQTGVIVPLAAGNYWIGHVFETDTNNVTASYYDTLKILADTLIGNRHWGITNRPDIWWSNDENGLWEWNWGGPIRGLAAYLIAKYPAKEGDTFDTGWDHVLRRVTSTTTSQSVQGKGSLPTIRYWTESYPPRALMAREEYSPNLGPTTFEYEYQTPTAKRTHYIWELTDYSIH